MPGDLGEARDSATLDGALRLLVTEPCPELIASGMRRYGRAADGLRPDTAPFSAALERASGIRPVPLGKLSRAFFAVDRRADRA